MRFELKEFPTKTTAPPWTTSKLFIRFRANSQTVKPEWHPPSPRIPPAKDEDDPRSRTPHATFPDARDCAQLCRSQSPRQNVCESSHSPLVGPLRSSRWDDRTPTPSMASGSLQ